MHHDQPIAATRQQREPALDGLRALCVLAVLAYHQPFAWLPGGFLAVSTFFTLSGFLITRLVLDEFAATGRINALRFTGRRLRRLMPAAAVVVLATVAVWAATNRTMPTGDAPAALSYVANWWHLSTGQGYAQLFSVASPFQHYWSLAIEEQFYLIFPLLAFGLHRLVRRRVGWFAAGISLLAIASFGAAGFASGNTAYYGTHTRAGEILVGSLLAVVLSTSTGQARVRRFTASPFGAVAGLAAIVGLLSLWATATLATSWLFPWATLANALASAVLIAECSGGRLVRRALAIRPAAVVGRISYSMYLVHWPLFLILTPSVFAVPAAAVFAMRLLGSGLLAAIVFHFVEEPARTGRRWRSVRLPLAIGGLSFAAVSLAMVFTSPAPSPIDINAIDAERARLLTMEPPSAPVAPVDPRTTPTPERDADPTSSGETAGPTLATAAPVVAGPPQRVLFVGDSTSWSLSLGVAEEMLPAGVTVTAFPAVGCGIGGATPISYLNQAVTTSSSCDDWFRQLPEVIRRFDPDVVFVVGGLADLSEREVPDVGWSHIGDTRFDAWLSDRMQHTADLLTAGGATVLWSTLPHVFVLPNPGFTGDPPFAENDPTRAERYNELIEQFAATDDRVATLEFAEFLARRDGGEFAPGLRPDGVHIDSRRFPDVAQFFVDAALSARPETGT